jgi:pyruvate formate lyase activating enzyme
MIARHWSTEGDAVRCTLCPHHCLIKEGQVGICMVRKNEGGRLVTLVYGLAAAMHVDPIEKKPLFHFLPGSAAFSIATVGCNFRCGFCQNWTLSRAPKELKKVLGEEMLPDQVVQMALRAKCRSISYTYSEPTIYYEYALDCGKLAKEAGLKNNFVTNGYIETAPLEDLKGILDAANVDLKAFRESFYHKYCGGHLEPVLAAVKKMKTIGVWVEITTLVIPTLNDSEEELRDIARFIAQELDPDTPWHVSRFHPDYSLTDLPATPEQTLTRAREIGMEEGLQFVYTGNVWGDPGENTYCPNCKEIVIARAGFQVRALHMEFGRCRFCRTPIAGVWE